MPRLRFKPQTQIQPKTSPADQSARDVTQRFVYTDDRAMERPFDWRQIWRVLNYMKPYRLVVFWAFIATLAGALARLATPFVIAQSIDNAIANANLQLLLKLAGVLCTLYLVIFASGSFRINLTNRVGQNVLRDMRQALFSHVEYLSFNFFDRRSAGSIMVRIINDVNALQDLLTNGVVNTLMDVLVIIGVTIIMLTLNWRLALATMVVVPVMILISTKVRLAIRRSWREVRIRSARINAHLNEAIQGMRVTEAFVQEPSNQAFFSHINDDYRTAANRSSKVGDAFGPLIDVTRATGVCIVYWYGALLCLQGDITVGLLVAFTSYMNQFWGPISRLGGLYNQMLQAMASCERIFEFLDTQPTVPEKIGANVLPPINGRVKFNNVKFAYTADRPALHGLSLDVKAGQTVALVGPTGSGKTTIVNLLCRFYDATEGAVLVDDINVQDVTLSSLRSQIGVVLQDTFLFSGTIMENIRFGKLEASDAEVIAAARSIGAHEFIEELPDAYQTIVNERGSGISQGQRQLISFARAILRDPRILVLDEATASIDTETEMRVQAALGRLLQGRTSFVVAHRLSTIRNADLIVVLAQGTIVQMGNHAQLLAEHGMYRDLVEAQFRFLGESVVK